MKIKKSTANMKVTMEYLNHLSYNPEPENFEWITKECFIKDLTIIDKENNDEINYDLCFIYNEDEYNYISSYIDGKLETKWYINKTPIEDLYTGWIVIDNEETRCGDYPKQLMIFN